ncbi:MAG: S8 family serine peptidase [Epulopiscium sp.]|nr:S8 family serine peptidase [Candidatus Epulonipiscium sp.]
MACGNGYASHGKYKGIAPESHIISVKILDKSGQGNSVHAIAGLKWILDNARKYNIRVVNLSIGTNDRKPNIPLMDAVNTLWYQGIVVIAAAGNPDGKRNYLPAPSISPRIITVGAWEDKFLYQTGTHGNSIFRKDTPSPPDIWAPGENIISVLSPDYCFDLQNRDTKKVVDEHYIKMSGTSMATPMVSGTAALMLEKYPNLTSDGLKRKLLYSCRQQVPPDQQGLLNIQACLA